MPKQQTSDDTSHPYELDQKALERLGFSSIDLQRIEINEKALNIIDKKLAQRYRIFPVQVNGHTLSIASADPLNMATMDDLLLITGYDIDLVVAPQEEIEWAINRYYLPEESWKPPAPVREEHTSMEESFLLDAKDKELAPVISLVRSIISTAIARGASDIHIEPHEFELIVRYRIDGILNDVMTLSNQLKPSIASSLKIMAQLKIMEKRKPQDGGFHLNVDNRMLDIRVSIVPAVFGEKIVLRLLNRENIYELDKLGFQSENLQKLRESIHFPYGIVLITGPTGSGKTTTLYASLNELNHHQKNITTIEDPVEYVLPRINQIQINPQSGLTFANGLRTILRQDPDIIMVGEIRDEETAKIAVQAALTGHLVLSTLHTNDALGSLYRLMNMGIEPYLLAASIKGMLAQRLVRKICPECKAEEKVPQHVLERIGIHRHKDVPKVFYKGKGCRLCQQTGYKGRISINEMIVIDDRLSDLISEGANEQQIRKHLSEQAFCTLADDGMQKVAQGLTTLEEFIRVVYN